MKIETGSKKWLIRKYQNEDCGQILKLFYDTVHSVNRRDYSEEQVNAWAPEEPDASFWQQSLESHYTLVAEQAGEVIGFGDVDGGYLDRLYVHRDHQGEGVASSLVRRLEAHVAAEGHERITVLASVTARPFFERRGYRVEEERTAKRRGVQLKQFLMEKRLPGCAESRGAAESHKTGGNPGKIRE